MENREKPIKKHNKKKQFLEKLAYNELLEDYYLEEFNKKEEKHGKKTKTENYRHY